jgi:hypothetical protein
MMKDHKTLSHKAIRHEIWFGDAKAADSGDELPFS